MTEDYYVEPYAEPTEEKKSNTVLIVIIVVVVVLIALCCCCVLGALLLPSLFGPAVGNVFSNIIEELEMTPMP